MLRIVLGFILFFSMCFAFATQDFVIASQHELLDASAGANRPYLEGGWCFDFAGGDLVMFPARTDGEGLAMCYERDKLLTSIPSWSPPSPKPIQYKIFKHGKII